MSKTKTPPSPADRKSGSLTQLEELLLQAIETEMGGVEIYRTALQCVQNDDLREEWQKYLGQTEDHVRALQGVFAEMGLDPDRDSPGRQVVRHIGKSLVQAMHMALGADDPAAAEIVAAECVTLAETKDHLNWMLLGQLLEEGDVPARARLQEAQETIEDQEDEHLYHSEGWARELWLDSLGLEAALPPPEEEEDVKSAAEAEKAAKGRKKYVG
jgi:hypothetical protein